MQLVEGDAAPDFSLNDENSEPVKLSDFRGRKVVLYFYPKDDTPGCSIQARDFSRDLHLFKEKNAQVIGVSPDSRESHCAFRDKYKINYPLLVDDKKEASTAYGVWVEKNFLGIKSMGVKRSTFIIDEKGKILKAIYGVQPIGHAGALLQFI